MPTTKVLNFVVSTLLMVAYGVKLRASKAAIEEFFTRFFILIGVYNVLFLFKMLLR